MIGKVLGASDDPRFSESRKPQRLRLVELRILEGGEPYKSIDQRVPQSSLAMNSMFADTTLTCAAWGRQFAVRIGAWTEAMSTWIVDCVLAES